MQNRPQAGSYKKPVFVSSSTRMGISPGVIGTRESSGLRLIRFGVFNFVACLCGDHFSKSAFSHRIL
jgi:hypothetical protein